MAVTHNSRVGVVTAFITALFLQCQAQQLRIGISPQNAKLSDRVVFTCTAPGPSANNNLKLTKVFPGEDPYTVATNGDISAEYQRYSRWAGSASVSLVNGIPVQTITLAGAQGGDAGKYQCHFGNQTDSADLNVMVPVTEVYIEAQNISGGIKRFANGDTINIESDTNKRVSDESFDRLTLVAFVNGSLYQPTVDVSIGDAKVTGLFQVLMPTKDTSHERNGMGHYALTQKYRWYKGHKTPYNGKMLTFTARVGDTTPKSTTVGLNVLSSPEIKCPNSSAESALEQRAVLMCQVTANPIQDVRLMWQWYADGSRTPSQLLMGTTRKTYSANYKVVDGDTWNVFMNISSVVHDDLRQYSLIAELNGERATDTLRLEYPKLGGATTDASGIVPSFIVISASYLIHVVLN